MTTPEVIGLVVLIVTAFLFLAFTAWRRKVSGSFRRIDAFERLNREVDLSVENGTRLHISLGRGNLYTARGGSALAGLAMLRRISERTSVSDRPPIVSSGDAPLAILSQDSSQAGYRAAGAEDAYRVTGGRLTGLSPFAYAAGALPIARDENVSAHILIGDLGAESGLITDAAERQNARLIAASDNLSAQAIFYASAQEPLIGEELFAAGAYTRAGVSHEASLTVQDVLRWVIILVILVGAALTILGFGF